MFIRIPNAAFAKRSVCVCVIMFVNKHQKFQYFSVLSDWKRQFEVRNNCLSEGSGQFFHRGGQDPTNPDISSFTAMMLTMSGFSETS